MNLIGEDIADGKLAFDVAVVAFLRLHRLGISLEATETKCNGM